MSVRIDERLGVRPGIEVAREGDGVERRAGHIVRTREEPEIGGIGPEAEVQETRVAGIGELEPTLVAPGGWEPTADAGADLAIGVVADRVGDDTTGGRDRARRITMEIGERPAEATGGGADREPGPGRVDRGVRPGPARWGIADDDGALPGIRVRVGAAGGGLRQMATQGVEGERRGGPGCRGDADEAVGEVVGLRVGLDRASSSPRRSSSPHWRCRPRRSRRRCTCG